MEKVTTQLTPISASVNELFSQSRQHDAHHISRMLNLFSLPPKVPQNIGTNCLRLEGEPVGVLQSAGPILKSLSSLEQPGPLRVVVRRVRVRVVRG